MFEEDPCWVSWLEDLAPSTRRVVPGVARRFFEFLGMEPREAVAWQRAHPMDYRFVDSARQWLNGGELRHNTMVTRYGMIRGFFLASRAPMPRARVRFHTEKETVVGHLTVEGFRKLLLTCNLKYKAIFLMVFQGGLDINGLQYVNTHHADYVWKMVQKGEKMIRLELPGRKRYRNIRPFYTFIGSDSIEALNHYFHSLGWKKPKFLFQNQYLRPLSRGSLQQYFLRHAVKAGLIALQTPKCLSCGGVTVKKLKQRKTGNWACYTCTSCQREHRFSEFNQPASEWASHRYGVNVHELRDVFRTEWHRASSAVGCDGDCAEFMLGHKIDPLGYDKIMHDHAYARDQYRKAMPFLNILSENPRVIPRSEVESELGVLQREVKKLKRDHEEVLQLLAKSVSTPE